VRDPAPRSLSPGAADGSGMGGKAVPDGAWRRTGSGHWLRGIIGSLRSLCRRGGRGCSHGGTRLSSPAKHTMCLPDCGASRGSKQLAVWHLHTCSGACGDREPHTDSTERSSRGSSSRCLLGREARVPGHGQQLQVGRSSAAAFQAGISEPGLGLQLQLWHCWPLKRVRAGSWFPACRAVWAFDMQTSQKRLVYNGALGSCRRTLYCFRCPQPSCICAIPAAPASPGGALACCRL